METRATNPIVSCFSSFPRKHKKAKAWINQTLLYLLVGHCTWAFMGLEKESNLARGWDKTGREYSLEHVVNRLVEPTAATSLADTDAAPSVSGFKRGAGRGVEKPSQRRAISRRTAEKVEKDTKQKFNWRDEISNKRHSQIQSGLKVEDTGGTKVLHRRS